MQYKDNYHFHRGNLPHIYIPNSTYFITFRLFGSIPASKIKCLREKFESDKTKKDNTDKNKQEAKFLLEYDKLLHQYKNVQYLKDFQIAKIVKEQIFKLDGKDYDLICFTIMSNHVHLVFSFKENSRRLDKIMQELKRMSAYYANKLLNKRGSFWQKESYDHIVRNEDELEKIVKYVIFNPVKAGLVDNWVDWEHTYLY